MSAEESPDPDDPLEYWIEEHRKVVRNPATVNGDRNALNHLKEYLEEKGLKPSELTRAEAINFINWLKNKPNLSNRTIDTYVGKYNEFYGYFSDRGTFQVNPISSALNEVKIEYDDTPVRRDISVEEMAEFLRSINHPQRFTICTILAKTGMRGGELLNLDLRDLHLDYPNINEHLPKPRSEIREQPDTLIVDSNVTKGQPHNGEVRDDGNKRERTTLIPLDNELKQTLIYWLACRLPSRSDAEPLLQLGSGRNGKVQGDRHSNSGIHSCVRKEAEAYGWYEEGAGLEWNVTPHYFRHFFTTHARQRFDDQTVVQYIRGDAGKETMDTYTHNWGDKVENQYRENIFKFFE